MSCESESGEGHLLGFDGGTKEPLGIPFEASRGALVRTEFLSRRFG